jgi:predicted Zn-dependent protease
MRKMSETSNKRFDRRHFLAGTLPLLVGLPLCGCRSAPITGRKQLVVVPEGKELSLGAEAFQKTISESPRSSNTAAAEIIKRVGQRIADVAQRSDYQWEFELIASPEQNAFCLPGGKVAIYEGILPVCQDEGGLAVVMSHEVAHALARHGGERMSQNFAVEGVRQVTDMVTKWKAPDKSEMILRAYGVASNVGFLLPYSRKQESEADHIGVMLMAQAGYDPAVAPDFWTRFGAAKTADSTPEFLSTHPSDERRSENLQQLIPEAGQHYARAAQKFGAGETLPI